MFCLMYFVHHAVKAAPISMKGAERDYDLDQNRLHFIPVPHERSHKWLLVV